MNNNHIIPLTWVMLLALLLGSCSDRLGLDNDAADGDFVHFAPTVSEMNDQRPTPATNAMAAKRVVRLSRPEGTPQLYLHIEPALEMGGSRRRADGTRAIYTTNNTISKLFFTIFQENDAPTKPFVDKGLTTKDDNWMTTTEWPHGSDQKFKVYSISPFEPSFTDPKIGGVANTDQVSYATAPVLSYTMPDLASQADIVYAVSEALDPKVSHVITMNYRHLFSGIALAEGSMISGLKVKRVDIKGLYAKGSCDLKDLTWTVDKTVKKDFSLEKNYTAAGRYNTLITPSDRAELMVIPQTVPDGATVTVTTELTNGQERKLTASLAGTKLERGVVYWLILSTHAINWRYTLNVSQSSFDTPYNGGTAALTVNSWRTTANSDGSTTTQEAVPFKVEYSVDNGTTWTDKKPDWLTNAPAYVDGAMSSETNITTSGQTAVTHSHAANLRDRTAVTDYDLSLYNVNGEKIIGGASTANCYVIHGPGTYRIPCVYGNTLKSGTYNGYAVDADNESGQGKAFVDYSGTRISDSNYKFTPSSAAVLWQSTRDVITNANVTTGSDGMSYITFTVDKTNLQQGNAVIAARDASGTVMWSWHLWITDATLTAPNNDFLTQNLGWVSSSDSYNHYPARSVLLRITQTNPLSDAAPVVLTVNQIEADVDSDPSAGSGLYYQWGRKDPFRASVITKDNCELISTSQRAKLYHAIQNPSTPILYYVSNYYGDDTYDWTSDHYNVLWNSRYSTQQTNTPVEKSVYDPCPYGFRVPRGKKTYEDMYSSLPNMGYYRLNGNWSYWDGYTFAVSKQSDKYYWTSRANNDASSASSWFGFVVSSSGYNSQLYCSCLLPLRPYKDLDSGKTLQTSN